MCCGGCAPSATYAIFQEQPLALFLYFSERDQLIVDLERIECQRYGKEIRFLDEDFGLARVERINQGQFALFQQMLGRDRCHIGIVGCHEIA